MPTEVRFSVGSDVLSVPEISAVFGMEPDHGWSVSGINDGAVDHTGDLARAEMPH